MCGHASQLQLAYELWPATNCIAIVTHVPLSSSRVQLVAHSVM